MLKEGGCKDVWLNPLDAATRVTVIQELIPGFTTACTTSQVGPGSGKATLPCAAPNTSIVYNTLDIGYLVEFRNF